MDTFASMWVKSQALPEKNGRVTSIVSVGVCKKVEGFLIISKK